MGEGLRYSVRGIPLATVLGSAMVFAGAFYTLVMVMAGADLVQNLDALVSYMVLIATGIVLTARRYVSESLAVPIAGFAIGVSTIVANLSFMSTILDLHFLMSSISMVAGLILMFMATVNYLGYRYNVLRTTMTIAVLVAVTALPIFMDWYDSVPMGTIMTAHFEDMPMIVVYLAYMFILTRDGIRYVGVRERMSNTIDKMDDTGYTGGDAFILPSDVDAFTGDGTEGWTPVGDGPVRFERVVRLIHETHETEILLQIIEGVDHPVATARSAGSRSTVQATRFDVVHTVVLDGRIRVYGRDGMFVEIRVDVPPESGGFLVPARRRF